MHVKYHTPEVRERAQLKPARPGDAGMDLYNATDRQIVIPVGHSAMIEAGISVKIPDRWVGFIKPRSSTFVKKGIFVVEAVIDAGYTGPLYVVAWNPGLRGPNPDTHGLFSAGPVIVEPWSRIAQLVIVPHHALIPLEVDCLPTTERGCQGFGSTGS